MKKQNTRTLQVVIIVPLFRFLTLKHVMDLPLASNLPMRYVHCKCVHQSLAKCLLAGFSQRILIVKATRVLSASPPCAWGNLLLVFKAQRSHRGGPGEVCATDSGAGQVNEPYCLPLQISVRQQPLAFCLLLPPHTLHTFTGRHTFHTLPRDPCDGHNGVVLASGEYRLYLTQSLQVAFAHYALDGSSRFKWELNGRSDASAACCDHRDLI